MAEEKTKVALIGKEVMNRLQDHVDKTVTVAYVLEGKPITKTGKLVEAYFFGWVEIRTAEFSIVRGVSTDASSRKGVVIARMKKGYEVIPFIGEGVAIRKILAGDGTPIYENKLIPENYDCKTEREIYEFRKKSFGPELANRTMEERKKYLEEIETQIRPHD